MKIDINNQAKVKISLSFFKTITKRAGKILKLKDNSQISCALVNGQTIKKLNHQYRGINQITDVLAFPTGQTKFITNQPASAYLGEIVICFPRAKQQAKQQGHSIKQELTILLIHGILHLLGYGHETQAKRLKMDRLMEKIID